MVHGLPLIRLIKGKCLLVHEVEHGAEIFPLTHGNGKGHGIGMQTLAHGIKHRFKIRTEAINLVDKGDLRHAKVL